MTRILANPVDLAAFAAGAVLLLVLLTRLASVARRASRAKAVTIGLLVPAAMGLTLSASTSYRFAQGRLGITDVAERMILCGTAEAAIIALTLHSWGTKSKASAWLAYALVGVQAIPAFSVSGGAGGVVRIVLGPVLLALMLHKLLGIEAKLGGVQSNGLLASIGREIRERLTARLGIGRRGADSAEIARSRAADRAVRLATRKQWSRRAYDRLADAVDAAQHGLDPESAAAAEAAVVARIVRRKSVMALRRIDGGHVWSTRAVSGVAVIERPVGEIAEADTAEDTAAPAEPVISGWTGPRVSGPRHPRRRPRNLRPARVQQGPYAPAEQPEPAPASGPAGTRPAPVSEPRKRFDTRLFVHALRAYDPSMGPDTIADSLGITERTVRRHLNAPDVHLEHANTN